MISLILCSLLGLDFNLVSYPTPREVRQAFADLDDAKSEVALLKDRVSKLEANQCKCGDNVQLAPAPKPAIAEAKGDVSIPLEVTVIPPAVSTPPLPAARTESEVVECVNGKCFNVPQTKVKRGLFGRKRGW